MGEMPDIAARFQGLAAPHTVPLCTNALPMSVLPGACMHATRLRSVITAPALA